MSTQTDTRALPDGTSYDHPFESLSHPVRRELLSVLRGRRDAVSVDRLAMLVAAGVADEPLVDVTPEQQGEVHLALVHTHLPKLDEARLVDWRSDDGTVTVGDHPLLGDDRFWNIVAVDAEDWDAVLDALGIQERRAAIAVLAPVGDLDRRDLARRLAAHETDVEPGDVPDDAVEDTLTTLHHVSLPPLREAGLIAVDGETIRYEGHPDLHPAWIRLDAASGTPVDWTARSKPAAARTIQGRENVIARGQSLLERADEELFLLFTTDGLLCQGCIDRLQDAVDRGVDVYLGSQTQAVRDLVREEVPGATIWEPHLDWLNLPPNRECLGRLVFADREAVMIGTLGEKAEGTACETALTGEGEDNALVVLLRELLGSRLDHLDAQSEDFRSQIPL